MSFPLTMAVRTKGSKGPFHQLKPMPWFNVALQTHHFPNTDATHHQPPASQDTAQPEKKALDINLVLPDANASATRSGQHDDRATDSSSGCMEGGGASTNANQSSSTRCLEKNAELRQFIQDNPDYDGRNITIAVIGNGIHPSIDGLETTSQGEPNVIGIGDFTKAETTLPGVTGKMLIIPDSWKSSDGAYYLGSKAIIDLYPMKAREKFFNDSQKQALNDSVKLDTSTEWGDQSAVTFKAKLVEESTENPAMADCLSFFDGYEWRAAIDTTMTGDFRAYDPLDHVNNGDIET
ncbi:tripeptidyl-peptidase II Tpp2 [Dimargaris verticillata]|uniref:Tripeptidyl-peptidase II Tpp2 n=1 Tax=Dimargaris verticillata TaxID=2761393 RepID=A0A9W8B601_9FUNG|nr:tripeptidyl-peptidase II Tpp2 [Dimargaris verticillata]